MILNIIFALLVLGVAAAAFLIARKPNEFRVERSTLINAEAAAIFPYLNDLQKGQEWSPWVEMEPDANYQMSGPAAGVGATLTWNGKKTGAGKLTVTAAEAPSRVTMRLEFYKPMQAVNTCEYALKTEGAQTRMTWVMYGPNNLKGKIISLFIDCEKMCGDQFAKGLANLKTLVEKQPASKAA